MAVTERPTGSRGREAQATKKVPTLEGLRGLAAVGVLAYHVAYEANVSHSMAEPGHNLWSVLANGLEVCLSPFFVLSGLLLFRPFARAAISGTKRPATLPFLWKRALRIVPAYWAMALAVLLLLDWDKIDGLWFLLKPILMVHFVLTRSPMDWIPGLEPTWTVPTELVFYLSLPLVGWLVQKFASGGADESRRARRLVLPLSLIALASLGWTTFAYLPAMKADVFYYSFFPFGSFSFFAGGMALAALLAYAETRTEPPALFRMVAARPNLCWLGAGVVFLLNIPKPFGIPGMGTYGGLAQELTIQVLTILFAMLVVLPLTVPGVSSRLMDGVLGNPPVRFLGRMSYGIYLWHLPMIHVWFKNGSVFGNPAVPVGAFVGKAGFWELLVFVLAGSVLLATVSHYLIERPAERLRNLVGARP